MLKTRLLLSGVLALAAFCPATADAIVGGTTVDPKATPWMAALPDCGAALVARDRVVTAAHCVNGIGPEDLTHITFGDGTVRAGARVAVHPGYVRRALDRTANLEAPRDDIAIVQLDRPVSITPIALAAADAAAARTAARVLGRGFTAAPPAARTAAATSGLREAPQKILSDTTCRRFYAGAPRIFRSALDAPTMICAADPDRRRRPQRSACVRDSGGPLVVGARTSAMLAGIVSWGQRCGAAHDPTVFTQVSAYRRFTLSVEPVWAPVAGPGAATITGEARVGGTLRCIAPPWLSPPETVRYTWSAYRFTHGNPTRKSGTEGAYVVTAADRGRSIQCTVTAATAGGFASPRTVTGPRIPE